MSYKVYEYGQSHWTKIDEAAALEQISRRHKMWNKLVELDHAYRANVYDVLRDETQEKIDAESSTIEALVSKIRARRKAARKRTVDLGTLREELAAARERKRALVDAAKARRKQLVDERKAALDELRTAHWEAVKQAAHETNLYWCNYDDALRCYDVAAKRAARAGVELRFQRWTGAGKVAVRFQTGLRVPVALACTDKRFQLEPVPAETYTGPRSVRRKLSRTKSRIRVGSNPDRSPPTTPFRA